MFVPVTNHPYSQNRTQNINSRRLHNFLGAMCLEFRSGIYHIKVFYSPYKQSSLCFLCSSFFLLISIVRVLHHCTTLQSAVLLCNLLGEKEWLIVSFWKAKYVLACSLQQHPYWERYCLYSPPLIFFSFPFFLPQTLGNKAILDESQTPKFY